ncbi:hypothetical protein AZ023_003544 [Klebsiella pneumoniae]|nr:hypothetical protein AZ023_003544 [Klebsiella pneumoniae]
MLVVVLVAPFVLPVLWGFVAVWEVVCGFCPLPCFLFFSFCFFFVFGCLLDILCVLLVAVLVVVAGLPAFLPVSGGFPVIVVGDLLGFFGATVNRFGVVVGFGWVVVVVLIFLRRLFCLIGILLLRPRAHVCRVGGGLLVIHLLLVVLGVVVVVLLLAVVLHFLFLPVTVVFALVVGGVLVLAAGVVIGCRRLGVGVEAVVLGGAFVLGCFRWVVLWLGFWRWGVAISGGLVVGVGGFAACGLFFVVAVWLLVGAVVLVVYLSVCFLVLGAVGLFGVGFVFGFVVVLVAVVVFLGLLRRLSLLPFAVLRFLVGAAVYLVFLSGVLRLGCGWGEGCSFVWAVFGIVGFVGSSRLCAGFVLGAVRFLVVADCAPFEVFIGGVACVWSLWFCGVRPRVWVWVVGAVFWRLCGLGPLCMVCVGFARVFGCGVVLVWIGFF